ncbi:MAG: hypothetical protein ACOX2P_03870 [Bacillota bacterium]
MDNMQPMTQTPQEITGVMTDLTNFKGEFQLKGQDLTPRCLGILLTIHDTQTAAQDR